MVMYREVCPEGVQTKCPGGGGGGGGYGVEALCPGGVWCSSFMSWGGMV